MVKDLLLWMICLFLHSKSFLMFICCLCDEGKWISKNTNTFDEEAKKKKRTEDEEDESILLSKL